MRLTTLSRATALLLTLTVHILCVSNASASMFVNTINKALGVRSLQYLNHTNQHLNDTDLLVPLRDYPTCDPVHGPAKNCVPAGSGAVRLSGGIGASELAMAVVFEVVVVGFL